MQKTARALDLLSRDIFACFLQPDYIDNVYLFERRLHESKRKSLLCLARMRERKLDTLFDLLMDMALLRHRVSDHTIFSLCSSELSAISEEISKLFLEMSGIVRDEIVLAEKIQLFEDMFRHVLNVTAREPLAFLLFIASLKAFRKAAEFDD